MREAGQALSLRSTQNVCGWCGIFTEHLQEFMQAALFFTGSEDRVEEIVLAALDLAIAQTNLLPSQREARRFVLRAALTETWRGLLPQTPILAAA